MSNNITSNYNALFNNRPAPTPLIGNAPQGALPAQPQDAMMLSANPMAAPSVMASPDQRTQLLELRKQLMDVDREIQQMMTQMGTAATVPVAPAAIPIGANGTVNVATAAGGQYTVQPGDYLWKIAKTQLGDANRWPEIYNLNRNVIGDNPNLMQPGQVLLMPPARGVAPQPSPTQPVFTPVPQQPIPQPVPIAAPPVAPPGPILQPPAINPLPSGTVDVAAVPSNRQLADQDAFNWGREFGLIDPTKPLTPDAKANVGAFVDEIQSYESTYRGQVFGPGMEKVAANGQEVQAFHSGVQQIQTALNMLIATGKLHPKLANGQPVQSLPTSGSFFKVDAQGNPQLDAQGNPLIDESFVAAITQFKVDHGIHQNYKLADGSYAINEYVGPNTLNSMKQALLQLQGQA